LNNINVLYLFLQNIWKSPKSVATILSKADKNDLKNNLAHLITHNIYENIFSSNSKEEQLIYIIGLLLKEEINNLNDKDNIDKNLETSFLKETPCGFIFDEFIYKKELQSFFKNILIDIIKNIETLYSYPMIFNLDEIDKDLSKNKITSNYQKNQLSEKEKIQQFNQKYIIPLRKKELENIISNEKDEEIKAFLNKKILDCEKSENLYSPSKFLDKLSSFKTAFEIYFYYGKCLIEVTELIDIFLDKLLSNINLLPYSTKCICKIISILLDKKYPNLKQIEKNKFLAKFFFEKLLFPILESPSDTILINECLITDRSKERLKEIKKVLNKLVLGKFFEENEDLVPVNNYIIEKMPKLIDIFNNINQVVLPPFIDKLINDEIEENYEYDYFIENPEENIFYMNICFNINELYSLINNAIKCADSISISKIYLDKLKHYMKQFEEIKNSLENIYLDDNKNKRIIKYFLLSESFYNENNKKQLKITKNREHFSLKELKIIENEEQKEKNKIIKTKNFFFALLYNYPNITKTDFKEKNIFDILNILKELKNNSYMNSFWNIEQKSVPCKWYINSLIQYLGKLPDKYKQNNYELLVNDLENEIINSIKEIKFEDLSIFIEYIKEMGKEKFYYENVKNIINDIDLNKKARKFIEKEDIPVSLIVKDEKTLILSKHKKGLLNKNKNTPINNIRKFINGFPNIADNEEYQGLETIDLIKKMKVPEIIKEYFVNVKESLKEYIKNENIKETNFETIYNKIYDYIMENLYEKLFPKLPDRKDIDILNICHKNCWLEPSNIINSKKNYVFDSFLPDAIKHFNEINREKSPRKKILCIKEINNCLGKLGKFNEDKVEGTDDQLPLLYYTFIKAKPEFIYSNCDYIEMFLRKNGKGEEGSLLIKLKLICEKVLRMTFKDLYNITETEYEENCNLIVNGDFFSI